MKNLLYVFILTGLFACTELNEKKQKENLFFYTHVSDYNYVSDTLIEHKIKRHDIRDTLISSREFYHNGDLHHIAMFTSDLYAPIDGGQLSYELDKMGIIYARSTTWPSYSILSSNNDSINTLIEVAIGHILLYPELSCYQYELIFRGAVKFIPPSTTE